MPQYKTSYFSEFSQEQIFALVADIESYPDFIPWCEAVRITKKQDTYIIADLAVKFSVFKATYSSKIQLFHPEKILVHLESGPFKKLETVWKFHHHKSGTKISFEIEFEFNSSLFESMISPYFEKAAHKITDAFKKRAYGIYGNHNG